MGDACHFVDLMYWLLDVGPISISAYSLPRGKTDPIGENNLAAGFASRRFDRQLDLVHRRQPEIERRTGRGFCAGTGSVHGEFQQAFHSPRNHVIEETLLGGKGVQSSDARFFRCNSRRSRCRRNPCRWRACHHWMLANVGVGTNKRTTAHRHRAHSARLK